MVQKHPLSCLFNSFILILCNDCHLTFPKQSNANMRERVRKGGRERQEKFIKESDVGDNDNGTGADD